MLRDETTNPKLHPSCLQSLDRHSCFCRTKEPANTRLWEWMFAHKRRHVLKAHLQTMELDLLKLTSKNAYQTWGFDSREGPESTQKKARRRVLPWISKTKHNTRTPVVVFPAHHILVEFPPLKRKPLWPHQKKTFLISFQFSNVSKLKQRFYNSQSAMRISASGKCQESCGRFRCSNHLIRGRERHVKNRAPER